MAGMTIEGLIEEGRAVLRAEQLEERAALLAVVEHDPVVMAVLRLLAAVQEDRLSLAEDLL